MNAKITAFGAFQMYSSTFEEEWMTGWGGGRGGAGCHSTVKVTVKRKTRKKSYFWLFYKWLNDITSKTGNGMFVAVNSLLFEFIVSSSGRVVSRTSTLTRPALKANSIFNFFLSIIKGEWASYNLIVGWSIKKSVREIYQPYHLQLCDVE